MLSNINSSNTNNTSSNTTTNTTSSGSLTNVASELQAAIDELMNYTNNPNTSVIINAPEVPTTDAASNTAPKNEEDDEPTNRFDLIDIEE